MYSVGDILWGELASEVVPRADFVSDVSIESGAKPFDSPGWDMEYTVFDDCQLGVRAIEYTKIW